MLDISDRCCPANFCGATNKVDKQGEAVLVEYEKKTCATCGAQLKDKYCHRCGERFHQRDEFAISHYSREIIYQITHLDAKIFKTLLLLVTRPGQLTEEYLLGRKSKYVRPIRLYLSLSMLYFFSFSFFDKAALLDIRLLFAFDFTGRLLPALTAKQQLSGLSDELFFRGINQQLNSKISLLLFLAIFVYAVVFKVIFLAKNRYYVEHLIFCLHLMSFSFLRDMLFLPLFLFNKPVGFGLALLTTVFYLFLSMRRVYSANIVKITVATVGLYTAFGVIFCGCAVFAIYQILFL